ncbi:MAG: hypothetical protein V1761_02345 [bacterium]
MKKIIVLLILNLLFVSFTACARTTDFSSTTLPIVTTSTIDPSTSTASMTVVTSTTTGLTTGITTSQASTSTELITTTVPSTTALPTTTIVTATMPLDVSRFENPFGFATLAITDRSDVTSGYYVVDSEIAFLDALMAEDVAIIEITVDLDLGYLEVTAATTAAGRSVSEFSDVYRKHSHDPLLHPILKQTGVGQVRLIGYQGLMIFSENGASIRHAGFLIDGSSDIVIRNLAFSELWEWDEIDAGGYKTNDWDYFTIEDSRGIWLDHLEFSQAYDGICDVKANSGEITLSWSKLDFRPNDFVAAQIAYLEETRGEHPYYDSIRDAGVSQADVAWYASCQKKGFNFGNTTDGTGFETITATFHHLQVYNLQDRFPRLRKGDIHLYQVVLDNTELYQLSFRLSGSPASLVNQGIVTTEQGAVLMENSMFLYVSTPIKNHQETSLDIKYSGEYKVLNSSLLTATRDYFGSSEDANTLWVHAGTYAKLEFGFRNYSVIPYEYELEDVVFLAETFAAYPTGTVSNLGIDWLKTNITAA